LYREIAPRSSVVVHPQKALLHSMCLSFVDGSMLAQLSTPDLPAHQYALTYPTAPPTTRPKPPRQTRSLTSKNPIHVSPLSTRAQRANRRYPSPPYSMPPTKSPLKPSSHRRINFPQFRERFAARMDEAQGCLPSHVVKISKPITLARLSLL